MFYRLPWLMARLRKPQWPALPRRAPGTGSLQRLKDGTLRARLPARVDPKRTAREFPPPALAEAQAWLDGWLTGDGRTGGMSLADWKGLWWEQYVKAVRPPTTAKLYFGALAMLARLDGKALSALTPSDFQRVVADQAGRIAPATIRVRISIWRSCLERAVDDGLIGRNPVRGLVVGTASKSRARRGWTAKEARAFWAAIRGHRFEALYGLILGCGLRIGEVLGLSWANVDLEGHRLWVEPQYTNGFWRDSPKGHNPHWINLPLPVVHLLVAHRDRQPSGTQLVFSSPHKRSPRSAEGRARVAADAKAGRTESPWAYSTVRREFLKLAVEVGLVDQRQHAGRHALGSWLIDKGVPPPVVADMLGHADASVTLGVYSHASGQSAERAYQLVEELLSGGVSEDDPEA